MSVIDKIGIENVLNIIFVLENIRLAFLIQPVDYGETSENDPKTLYILKCIHDNFPNLILSYNYQHYQGIIISKNNYNGLFDIDNIKIGQILGYPCYLDFDNLDRNNETYMINMVVKLHNGQEIVIFTNICKNLNNLHIFDEMAELAKKLLINNTKYIELLEGNNIINVYSDYRKNVSNKSIIYKLLSNVKIDDDDLMVISNIFYNNDYDDIIISKIMKTLQFDNQVHIGILLSVIINHENDILSPFYPLQQFPPERIEVKTISKKLSNDLLYILESSHI